MRVLIVEDELALADAIAAALGREGYAVDVVGDGDEALEWLENYDYDLAVIDRILPAREGLEVVREVRRRGNKVPILLLTALTSVDDRVRGLDAGADDYLGKPFAIDELRARIRALRRRDSGEADPVLRIGSLEMDPGRRRVTAGGRDVRLTTREFALLEVLARHPGHVFSQDRLVESVWNADFSAESNVVEVHIHSLRRKLDPGDGPSYIETVRGSGYRLRES